VYRSNSEKKDMAAEVINGVWTQDVGNRDAATEVSAADAIGPLINQLGALVVQAQGLSDEDYRRLTNCVNAAGDLMTSRVRLSSADRQMFEAALRDAVVKKHGVIF
jgi:hypothetical protein